MIKLNSTQHPLVKHWTKLREHRKYRQEKQAVFIEGKILISEIGLPIKALILREGTELSAPLKPHQTYIVSAPIFDKISGVPSPEGVAAEIDLPPEADLSHKKCILALDHLSDPGNLGTLMRTALAFGFDALFMTENSVDPFNEKALRAAKGATFKLPIKQGTCEELMSLAQSGGFHLYIADLDGTPFEKIQIQFPLILLLGNEARGISNEMRKNGIPITIPMSTQMQSLNVAAAGAILMCKMGQFRG